MSEVVGRQPEWSQCIGAPQIGAWGGHSVADERWKLPCRGLVMEAASSYVGGRNEADSMATARVEEGTKQPDVGSSEKQAEVAG